MKDIKYYAWVTTDPQCLDGKRPKVDLTIMSEGAVQKLFAELTMQAIPENHSSALVQAESRMRRDRWRIVGKWRKAPMGYEAEVEQF